MTNEGNGGAQFPPTEEQQGIVASAKAGGSMMVKAYAGTGKTSTIVLMSKVIQAPSLALAFNKSIEKELGKRLPSNFTTKTLNGLGHGAWMRALRSTKVELDDRKQGRIITEVAKALKMQLLTEDWDGARRLLSAAMQNGISPNNEGQPLMPDTKDSWEELALELFLPRAKWEGLIEVAREALKVSVEEGKKGKISFDDQIYLPTVLGGAWPQFPLTIVDEAQDLSPLNHRMLQLATKANGRIIAVGDPKQAIYAFRGADSQSMTNLQRLREEWTVLPLATTFRCPKLIVQRQVEHAPGYRAWAGCKDGRVERLGAPWNWADVEALRPQGGELAVLCRNNAPLFSLAFKLLRQRIGVVMAGRDIGKGLISLTKQLAKADETPLNALLAAVEAWKQKEMELARLNKKEEHGERVTDQAESLFAIASGAEARTAGELRSAIDLIFARSEGTVRLSSIHRSKGLEWDAVMHLDPWRIPSKGATRAAALGDSSGLEQEWNLKYVCETRSKNVLLEADLEAFGNE